MLGEISICRSQGVREPVTSLKIVSGSEVREEELGRGQGNVGGEKTEPSHLISP